MPFVTPTQRWMGPKVRIPRLGSVKRDGNQSIDVTEAQAAWLVQRFMAKRVDETLVSVPLTLTEGSNETTTHQPNQETTHQPNQETTHQPNQEDTLGDLGVDPTRATTQTQPVAPDWQTTLLTFFNTAETKEAIADAILGIGPKTAEHLIQARPLDWDKVAQVLTKAQVEAAKTWAEEQ